MESLLPHFITKSVAVFVKPGPVPYLNAVEEKALGRFLKECTSVGYGKTRKAGHPVFPKTFSTNLG